MLLVAELCPDEKRQHKAFETLLWALAEPGSVHRLPRPGLDDVAECLVDLEVTTFTPDVELARKLRQLGAGQASAAEADYLFIPSANASS